MCACNIKTKKIGNWLGLVMDLFGRLLDLSLENNAFLAALMDLFQKNSSRLIKLIVIARPNLSWHYDIPNSFATMKSHEIHSKAYWMTIEEVCRTLITFMFLNPTMQSLCKVVKCQKGIG